MRRKVEKKPLKDQQNILGDHSYRAVIEKKKLFI